MARTKLGLGYDRLGWSNHRLLGVGLVGDIKGQLYWTVAPTVELSIAGNGGRFWLQHP